MDRRWLQRAGALALVLAVALATARPSRAQTPPLDTLVEQIPSSAVAVRLSTLDLDGYADAALGYALNMSVDLAWDGSQQTIQQQSFALYRYDGAEWRSIFDGNAFGLHLFRTVPAAASVLAPSGSVLGGPLLRFTAVPLPAHDSLPDLLALEIAYEQPLSAARLPAIAILQPVDDGYSVLYSTVFKAPGRIATLLPTTGGLTIDADSRAPGDPDCCPGNTELIHLALQPDGSLAETERCIRPGRYIFSCS
jgi:hypothetical protein